MRTSHRTVVIALFSIALAFVAGCVADTDDDSDLNDETSSTEQDLSSNQHAAFDYFVARGLSKRQAAGIVGNLIQESSVNPNAVEFGGGPGRGIAQWSVGGRWDTSHGDNVTSYASQHGESRWALTTQLDFIWFELTTDGYGYSALKAATTVSAAVLAFQDKYEICGTCDQTKRVEYANQVLADYGGGSSGGGGGGGAGCYSSTLGKQMPANACVQSKFDDLWYQCDNGSWVDRWTDPTACSSVHPL
jgi:hypothetical protein